jgi:hypothetical protein
VTVLLATAIAATPANKITDAPASSFVDGKLIMSSLPIPLDGHPHAGSV